MSNQPRDIKYINRDFSSLMDTLRDFTKTYFPNTFNDFTDADPGTMFMEMSAVVGDVLSFFQDNQLQEAFLLWAQEKENLMALAYAMGYRTKVTSTSTVNLDVLQLIPAVTGVADPDMNYALIVDKGATIQSVSDPTVSFITQNVVNFAFSSSEDPTTTNVYTIDQNTSLPEYYILKKSVPAIAGTIKTVSFDFGSPTRFATVNIQDDNIIQILSVSDSDGNNWYEVPFLAQSTIFDLVQNVMVNDPNFVQFSDTVPYMLRLKKVPRRFVTRFRTDNTMEIEFGPGTLSVPDEEVIPNPDNVGLGLINGISKLNQAFDPSNFLYTQDYGLAPSNTTLTFTYMVGGGVGTNVPSNDITRITGLNTSPASVSTGLLNQPLLAQIQQSVAFNNPSGSQGGGDGDSVDDIRNNTEAAFPAQLRCVTDEDYQIRALSLPSQLGTLAKVYVVQDQLLNSQVNKTDFLNSNPLALSMYILGYNNNKNIIQTNTALKTNLKTYLSQFRMKTDAVTIKDAFYVNLKVLFDIIVLPNFNSKEVLTNCVTALETFFNIDLWQINQPIVLSDIFVLLSKIKGVQTILNLRIENITDDSGVIYSPYGYDIQGATKNGTIYPSLDPCIFEVRYPSTDIYGRVVTI